MSRSKSKLICSLGEARAGNGSSYRNLLRVAAYRASRSSLKLVRRDAGNGGASSALVTDPVQGIFGGILAIGPQAASAETNYSS